MKIYFLPKTKFSKLSSILLLSFVFFLIVFYLIIGIFDVRGGDTFFSNPSLFIPILLAWTSAFLALITAIIAIIKEKARSMMVFLSMVVGFAVTIFGLAEVLFPH
ncbi:MAG: hypothetical protein KAQ68_03730 [Clostridiales bacterium]|nr:hypothetical protein [Clostridiales bacterium]